MPPLSVGDLKKPGTWSEMTDRASPFHTVLEVSRGGFVSSWVVLGF